MIYEVTGTPTDPHRYTAARIRARDREEAIRIAGCIGLNATDATPAQDLETTKALLQEASEWARHYSSVRMTVTTFLITLSTGILAFRWGNDLFADFAWWVWTIAAGFFLAFTVPEWINLRHRHINLQKLRGRQSAGPGWWIFSMFGLDAGLISLVVLSLFFYFGGYPASVEAPERSLDRSLIPAFDLTGD